MEVKVYCEDSKLQKIMWALDGMIVGMPQVIPVRGAKASPDKKKVVSATKGGSSIKDRIASEILGSGMSEITTKQLVEMGMGVGAKRPQTVSATVFLLQAAGLLKRIEKGRYQINRTTGIM